MPYDSSRSTETEPVSAERWGGGRREEEEGKGGAKAQGNESLQWIPLGANQDPRGCTGRGQAEREASKRGLDWVSG